MVRLTDLVNAIPKDNVYKYEPGNSVCYNDKCHIVILKRDSNGKPAYQIRALESGEVHDLVLETELMSICGSDVFNEVWPKFNYNGNNQEACNWIMKNIITKACLKDVKFGPSEDGTKYVFQYYCTKDKECKCLEKAKN